MTAVATSRRYVYGMPEVQMNEPQNDRAHSDQLVSLLAPLTAQPTAREVIQFSLAKAVSGLLVAIEPGELSGVDASSALKRARRQARRVRVLLTVFSPLLQDSESASSESASSESASSESAARQSRSWRRELDTLIAELDRTWGSQALCDRFGSEDADEIGPAKAKSNKKRKVGDVWVERVASAADRRLSLDRVALHHLLARPGTRRLLDALVDIAVDPPMAPQADDPAEEQLVGIVSKLWQQTESEALKLASFATLTAAKSPPSAWDTVLEVAESAERSWFAAAALEPVYGKKARKAARRARRLYRLTSTLIELRDLEAWLSQVAERAHGQTAFAAGAMANSVWRDAKSVPKKWKAARRPGYFKTPEWLR